jgi:hypothetical protein
MYLDDIAATFFERHDGFNVLVVTWLVNITVFLDTLFEQQK